MNYKSGVFVGLSMIAITYGFARFSFGLVLPYLSDSLRISQTIAGIISSLSYLAYCLAIIFSMLLIPKIGARLVILMAGGFAFFGMILISTSPNSVVLAVGVFIAGISTGLSSPPYASVVKYWIDKPDQDQANTWINSGTSLGIALAGIVVIFLSSEWRLTYILFAITALIILYMNAIIIPKDNNVVNHKIHKKIIISRHEISKSRFLVIVSTLLGISSAAYWTFSRDFLVQIGTLPDFLTTGFWIVIGLSGIFGGFAGSFIQKIGLVNSFRLSIICLASSGLLLSIFTSYLAPLFISAFLFGSSYIFMTGVFLIWGINIFIGNSALGVGLPFFVLALGQFFGSSIAGIVADYYGYNIMFILFSLLGFISIAFKPRL
jgi:predicted MFS family arabinose efflux permease